MLPLETLSGISSNALEVLAGNHNFHIVYSSYKTLEKVMLLCPTYFQTWPVAAPCFPCGQDLG
jgi:hypothetical protein